MLSAGILLTLQMIFVQLVSRELSCMNICKQNHKYGSLFFVASVTEKAVVSYQDRWKETQKNLVRSFF